MSKGICFVICPIGAEGSSERERSDVILNCIIKPVVTELGYDCVRADEIDHPGLITRQVIQHLLEAPLVIADLSFHNPNVFYELAIRHMRQMPCVQLIQEGERLPFDLANQRTISIDVRADKAEKAKAQLSKQIKAVEKDPKQVDNPVTETWNFMGLAKSENPLDKAVASIVERLDGFENDLYDLSDQVKCIDAPTKGLINRSGRDAVVEALLHVERENLLRQKRIADKELEKALEEAGQQLPKVIRGEMPPDNEK